MKTISFRLTDKQHHYLAALSKDQKRSIEHLVWLALSEGIDYMFCETPFHVEKLRCDFSDKDRERMSKYLLYTPSDGYDNEHRSLFSEISENVLADAERTFEQADAAFDLQAEIKGTAELHAQRKQDHESKEAAKKEQEAAQ